MASRSGRKTDITLWDHIVLRHRLLSMPRSVLKHFRACQIACLADLEVFRLIWIEDRAAAERVIAEAREMGIPLERS